MLKLKEGATYRGKHPRQYPNGEMNDRTILWMGDDQIQYDGPAVKDGWNYPTQTVDAFLKWASHEVPG